VVAPGFLKSPKVLKWLNGIEPAWTLLEFDSFNALRDEPSKRKRTIRLANDLTPAETATSAVARNTLLLLDHAHKSDGLKLTATGNLSRAVVDEMRPVMRWPDYDPAEAFAFHKVVNEPDFLPLHFVRSMAQMAQLLEPQRGKLAPTELGIGMLDTRHQGALQAILFHIAFWHADLGYLARSILGRWPQSDIGVVLWSLGAGASAWQSTETLTRLSTIPVNGVIESTWDLGSMAMEARVLRPLLWYGLLDHRREELPTPAFGGKHFYRKAALFDRFLTFDVHIQQPSAQRH
jgi:hypothetical protein